MTQPQNNRIKIANPPLEDEVRTYLTIDCGIGTTVISTLDNGGFITSGIVDYYILIGEYGDERSEIVLVDANGIGTSAIGFKISATKFSHEASDPVTFIRYNKIVFFGAVSSGGTKVALDTSVVSTSARDIDCSQSFTEYTYTGDTYNYFSSAYYNTNDDTLSGYSDEIENNSYTRQSIKRVIESGLRKGLTKLDEGPDAELNWDIAIETVQDGIDEILAKKRKWPFLRTINTGTFTVANQQYINKPSDLILPEYIMVNGVKLDNMSRNSYNNYTADGNTISVGQPTHFTLKNNKFYLYPTPNSAFPIIYEYYKTIAEITSDLSTEIDFAFVPILIYYCAAQFSYIRGNDKRGDKMYQMFLGLLEAQIIEYSGPEQTGDAESIERTSAYNDDNYGIFAELN